MRRSRKDAVVSTTRDVGIVDTLRIDRPDASGHHDFGFRLPEGPYSFSGKLITLAWAVEVVALPDGETERLDIGLGLRPVEISIG